MATMWDSAFDLFLRYRLGHVKKQSEAPCLYVDNSWPNLVNMPSVKRVAHLGERIQISELPAQASGTFRLCVIADTHERHENVVVPPCDLLIHAGDILMSSRKISQVAAIEKYADFNNWLGTLGMPPSRICVIGGNHDYHLEQLDSERRNRLLSNATFISDTLLHFPRGTGNLSLFGNSLSLGASNNKAWQSDEVCEQTFNSWAQINNHQAHPVDILLSHSVVPELLRVARPRIYVYGHFHAQYGVAFDAKIKVLFVCGSIMDPSYNPTNVPIVVDIPQ